MFGYLDTVYSKIVDPMNRSIKNIMMSYNLANEGELFACDLRFRLCHLGMNEDSTFYLGDPGVKNEDAISNLNTMKRKIINDYKQILNEIVSQAQPSDPNAQIHIAVAIYLASYFDINENCLKFY